MSAIVTIDLPFPLRMGQVNAYLVRGDGGQVLVDTGLPQRRRWLDAALDAALAASGPPLSLILLTHGDIDHAGNAAHLRSTRGVPVAMHAADVAMVERGDMRAGRSRGGLLMSPAVSALGGYGRDERLAPDLMVGEGDSLAAYGLEATVLHLGAHTRGSIGLLTAEGDLLCGDLLVNARRPGLSGIMDDVALAEESLERLRALPVRQVYPGHGRPFRLADVPRSSGQGHS